MGSASGNYQVEAARIVREFLAAPDDATNFHRFYDVALRLTIASVNYLQRRGYRLPESFENQESGSRDLAIDILGPFLRNDSAQPYPVIFDYFARHGISDFHAQDPELFFDQFRVLLQGFVKKELFRLKNQEDPLSAKLKKEVARIINSPEFEQRSDNKGGEFVRRASTRKVESADLPTLSVGALIEIAETAFASCTSIKKWVSSILQTINASAENTPWVRYHDLLAAVIIVNARHVELEAPSVSTFPSAVQMIFREEIDKECQAALELVRKNTLARFVEKGRVAHHEAELLMSAVTSYLADLTNGGETDVKPQYFRESMPEDAAERYLADYKYVFESILAKAEDELRLRLKKNPIIRQLGYYL